MTTEKTDIIIALLTLFATPLLTSYCVDQKLEDYKLQAEHREQANKIARYVSEVQTINTGKCGSTSSRMSEECIKRYQDAQQLSLELFLYSPKEETLNFYKNLGLGLRGDADKLCLALAEARDYIMQISDPEHASSLALCKKYIIVNSPNIGLKQQ